jgi:response regulator RpfG family c-di-GMP phosphodiesterase
VTASATLARVLVVDDEPHVLDAVRRMLRTEFLIETAADPVLALDAIRDTGPYAVVLSDFQMPRMNGAQFLAAARELHPDSSRILLTGQADLAGAAKVVNEGGILRLLLKPAGRPELSAALHAGVQAYHALTAERDLLDTTLRGSVRALTEVLALANPAAFARSTRLRNLVAAIVAATGQELEWHVEVAALLSDLGSIALPASLLERMDRGQPLTVDEQNMIDRLPSVADQILAGIPRLDEVRSAILREVPIDGEADAFETDDIPLGARVLRIARGFDQLLGQGADAPGAVATMRAQRGRYDPILLDALAEVVAGDAERQPREVGVEELLPGMVLVEDVFTNTGLKLVPRGSQLSASMIARVNNYAAMESGVAQPLLVYPASVSFNAL